MIEDVTPNDLEPGWYNDPQNPEDPTAWRKWDGSSWTEQTAVGENSPSLEFELQENIEEAQVMEGETGVFADPGNAGRDYWLVLAALFAIAAIVIVAIMIIL